MILKYLLLNKIFSSPALCGLPSINQGNFPYLGGPTGYVYFGFMYFILISSFVFFVFWDIISLNWFIDYRSALYLGYY